MIKRQTLLMALALVVVAVGVGIPFCSQMRSSFLAGPLRPVRFGGATLEVPGAFGEPAPGRFESWERYILPGKQGILLLAWEPADERPLAQAYARWFGLSEYSQGPVRYETRGRHCFFQEIPLFGQGAYVLQKRGKSLRFIASFSQNGNHYWVQLDTFNASTQTMQAFNTMLLSLKLPDGSRPEPSLATSLVAIQHGCRWSFVMPVELPILLPVAILVLVFGIQIAVRKRSGRLPDQAPGYAEGGLEIAISRTMQVQYLDAAVGITGEALTIYTFGTPFLVVPKAELAGRVSTGQGWLGGKYVQLELEGPLDLRKYRWKFRASKGARVRIFTQDDARLYYALMG